AARRVRRLGGGAPAAREGGRRAAPLLRALPGRGGRAGVVRAPVRVPPGSAPGERAGGPGGPAARRLLRADRLQDRAPQDAGPAQGGRATVALRGGRARGVVAGDRRAGLLLRAR